VCVIAIDMGVKVGGVCNWPVFYFYLKSPSRFVVLETLYENYFL
jgi:hypothetical protein